MFITSLYIKIIRIIKNFNFDAYIILKILDLIYLKKNINQQRIEIGKDANFKPINIDEFIETPSTFVTF